MLNPEQNEELRRAAREYLAIRHPAALPVRAIRRGLAHELDFQIEEPAITSALEFLKGLGHTASQFDELGSTVYWAATTEGVRAYERGGR